MEKLLRSLLILHDTRKDGGHDVHHLIGTAYHNTGVVQLWAGRYSSALTSFQSAVRIRSICSATNSSCLAVSLSKLGMVHFALDHLVDAVECFEGSLKLKLGSGGTSNGGKAVPTIFTTDEEVAFNPSTLELGKILNNIGVACYQNGSFSRALNHLTQSLEYYKSLIDSPLKRKSVLYDASVIISNVGRVYLEQGESDMALYMFEEACMVRRYG
jgi:tetratricopeptide (TPR) repeat protein